MSQGTLGRSHILFPVYAGALLWTSLLPQDERLLSFVRRRDSMAPVPTSRGWMPRYMEAKASADRLLDQLWYSGHERKEA